MKKFPDYIQKLLGSSIKEDIIIGLIYIKDYPDLLDYFDIKQAHIHWPYGVVFFSEHKTLDFIVKTKEYVFLINYNCIAITWEGKMKEAWLALPTKIIEL